MIIASPLAIDCIEKPLRSFGGHTLPNALARFVGQTSADAVACVFPIATDFIGGAHRSVAAHRRALDHVQSPFTFGRVVPAPPPTKSVSPSPLESPPPWDAGTFGAVEFPACDLATGAPA
jgi:hypothetical protein